MTDTRPTSPLVPKPKPGILDIAPYVGGKSSAEGFADPLKLSSNENVLGTSDAARRAYVGVAGKLHLYPDGRSNGLRGALAERFALEPERLIFGCGSDEIFTLLCQVYCQPGDNMVQGQYGFLAYRIAARAAQAEVRFAPEPEFRIDVDQVLQQVDARTRLVFIANPSNPTGTWISGAEVRRLHAALPSDVVLVLDGAYAEFADDPAYEDGLELARTAPNVIVCRTFSKMYGLAALRVGWAYAATAMIDAMDRIRAPFNINLPAQAAATAALADQAFLDRSRALVIEQRPRLEASLKRLGLKVYPSLGNFVLVRFPSEAGRTAAEAETFLAQRGVLVRGLGGYQIGDGLRITVGLPEHMDAVVEGLGAYLRVAEAVA
ncbi:histidinol-phosphate transaminase [Caulobacter sp. S45]|jgi:histidinol-phosphate aminotransferase|uniref:histidinol-phosphate transaminase n=1 Tax=Caulobacter sp. S45 TaxID=1641861 RepID=UPI00131E2A92|nr:histidinol-phosphate transaminase [Caulobacter sp. S45]